jgi:hypothetical protein
MATYPEITTFESKAMNLPMTEVVLSTPYYILMNQNCHIGPEIIPLHSGVNCKPIYGFSDKNSYDKFCLQSQQALTPYPLVKGFLRNQAGAPNNSLNLVVIDSAGPREPYLHAATMKTVLEAQENRTTHVTSDYRLVFEQEDNAYRVEEG